MTYTIQRLAEFVVEAKYEDLPPKVVHEAKRVFLDSVGCAVAGLDSEKGSYSVEVAKRLGGPTESSIIGTSHKVSAANAAFANGETINALDFDVILRPAVHITPWVIPSALALSESLSSSGKDLIAAIVLGHEVSNRLAMALSSKKPNPQNGDGAGANDRPIVSGYSFNAFGSTAGAGKILGLGIEGMSSALGTAGYNAPMQSFTQWERSGTNALIKYGSPGWVALGGVTAALLAEAGYTGDITLLDGEYGFWRYSGAKSWRPDALFDGLGQEWQILNVRYKRYPCCGITHSSLDCFTALIDDNDLKPEEIEQVNVWLDPTAELPLWQDRSIDNEVQAQFSVPYDLAVAAYRLDLNWEWLRPETRKDPNILGFMDKVTVSSHPNYKKAEMDDPMAQIARVEVKARGTTFTQENRYTSGRPSPERPGFSDRYLEEKFYHNASSRLSNKNIGEFIKRLWQMEDVADMAQMMALVAG